MDAVWLGKIRYYCGTGLICSIPFLKVSRSEWWHTNQFFHKLKTKAQVGLHIQCMVDHNQFMGSELPENVSLSVFLCSLHVFAAVVTRDKGGSHYNSIDHWWIHVLKGKKKNAKSGSQNVQVLVDGSCTEKRLLANHTDAVIVLDR